MYISQKTRGQIAARGVGIVEFAMGVRFPVRCFERKMEERMDHRSVNRS